KSDMGRERPRRRGCPGRGRFRSGVRRGAAGYSLPQADPEPGMGRLLSHLLAETARRAPDAPAIAGEVSLSYGALDGLASALAGALVEAGVRPGDRVALLLPPGPPGTLAAHAVLKAGAVYVPVEPSIPPARAALLLSTVGAKGVIGEAAS